jgi:hypothetical protein
MDEKAVLLHSVFHRNGTLVNKRRQGNVIDTVSVLQDPREGSGCAAPPVQCMVKLPFGLSYRTDSEAPECQITIRRH